MRIKFFVPLTLFVLGFVGSAIALRQEDAATTLPIAQPTDMHTWLAESVGEWNAECKLFMPGNLPPMVSAGSERVEMLGEMWQVSHFDGEIMGTRFQGQATMGYDTQTKKFVGVWTDTISSHMTHMEGTYDASTRTMKVDVRGRNPMTGEPTREKHVTRYPDENTRIFEMHAPDPSGGDDTVKTMEITYTRK